MSHKSVIHQLEGNKIKLWLVLVFRGFMTFLKVLFYFGMLSARIQDVPCYYCTSTRPTNRPVNLSDPKIGRSTFFRAKKPGDMSKNREVGNLNWNDINITSELYLCSLITNSNDRTVRPYTVRRVIRYNVCVRVWTECMCARTICTVEVALVVNFHVLYVAATRTPYCMLDSFYSREVRAN